MKNVTLAKGGTKERIVNAKDIQIEDLWHCCMALEEGKATEWSGQTQKAIAEQILSVWYLAHDLKRHIIGE